MLNETMFDELLEELSKKWSRLDLSEGGPLLTFTWCFKRYKRYIIVKSLLRPVREQAGLGCPPEDFTTNASESVNALLKNKVDCRRSQLPDFLNKLKEVIDEQDQELSRAVIGKGKYMLRPGFKKLWISEAKWFSIKEEARKQHLFKVANTHVWELDIDEIEKGLAPQQTSTVSSCSSSVSRDAGRSVIHRLLQETDIGGDSVNLSLGVSEFADLASIPRFVLNGIWQKAHKLVTDSDAITAAPRRRNVEVN